MRWRDIKEQMQTYLLIARNLTVRKSAEFLGIITWKAQYFFCVKLRIVIYNHGWFCRVERERFAGGV